MTNSDNDRCNKANFLLTEYPKNENKSKFAILDEDDDTGICIETNLQVSPLETEKLLKTKMKAEALYSRELDNEPF